MTELKPLKGIPRAGVTIARDGHGIPHITAETLADLYWGMGYAHALDRGMQMLLMRLLGQGRTAEHLDDSDEMVEIDRFFRRMNWSGHTRALIDGLEPELVALCDAYCEGVNVRLAQKIPLEYRLVGYRPEPWRIDDTVMLTRMIGYLTLAQSQAEVERLFVEMVRSGMDDALIDALFPGALEGVDRATLAEVTLGERVVPETLKWMGMAPRAMASNNWVVAGHKTASGAPMLSNDPHLEVNRLPNVWCEQVLRSGERAFSTMGMPGIPAALIGRTPHLAWGATYTFMDGVDSWIEDCRDGKFRRGDTWVPFEVRTERIARKKRGPIEVTFYENMHGVLDGDPRIPGKYLATRWAPSDSGADSLRAARAMLDARTVREGMQALGGLETTWNWVLADRDGVGYQMSGRMPRRAEGWDGFAPRPGWDPAFDWQGYVPHTELPRRIDPDEGYIVTANNDLNAWGEADPINSPMGDYRARRIAALLEARDDHDLDSFRAIHMDTYSLQADAFLAVLLPLVSRDHPHAQRLSAWDRRYATEATEPTLFEAFYAALRMEVFGKRGFGEDVLRHLAADTGVFIDFYQNFDDVLLNPESAWYAERSQQACFKAAFDAIAELAPAPWGATNRVTLTQIFFGGKLPRFLGFDKGPYPLPGGRATPHQGQVYRSAGRLTSFAPSVRIVADMADDLLHSSMAGGPSDRRFSKWYASGVAGWLRGELKVVRLEH